MSYSGFKSAFLFAAALGLAGCPGDDSGDTSTTDVATSEAATTEAATTDEATTDAATTDAATGDETADAGFGRIQVTVNYEGKGTGTLNVVLLTSFPPEGPPQALESDMEPTFPWTGTIGEVEPGDYFVFATLDIGNDNPTIPGDEDAQALEAAMVTVVAEEQATAEVTLVDPR